MWANLMIFIPAIVAFKDTVYKFLLWNAIKILPRHGCMLINQQWKTNLWENACVSCLPRRLYKIEKSFSPILTDYLIQEVRIIVFILSICTLQKFVLKTFHPFWGEGGDVQITFHRQYTVFTNYLYGISFIDRTPSSSGPNRPDYLL